MKTIRIKGGYRVIMDLYTPYRIKIYEYNSKIKESGYYLKPIHVVHKEVGDRKVKYIYFGRYWYRVVRNRGRKLRWVYVGKEKPDPHLPDPPLTPFEGIGVAVDNGDILVSENVFRALNEIAKMIAKKNLHELLAEQSK